MSYTAIQVESIGKQYEIGETLATSSFRERVMQTLSAPFAFNKKKEGETFWALKDINFNVQDGEVVGIIGRNGAGKSTMLKILSRITDPTEGRIRLRGRVGTLLEVGTGFHPELTGRENTYMNGAIIGMSRHEIDRKFDEIVEFSGIDRFIDTPVKRYSSGMYIRLAFAVAAHLETDILLVDEVLAVGDTAFQQKCLGKMNDVAQAGRTVLFISHNMSAIQDLCPRTIVLHHGKVIVDDKTENAMPYYLKNLDEAGNETTIYDAPRELDHWGQKLRISDIVLLNAKGEAVTTLQMGESFRIQVEFEFRETLDNVSIVIGIDTILSAPVTSVASEEVGQLYSGKVGDKVRVDISFENFVLNTGRYAIRGGLRIDKESIDFLRQGLIFS
ncbi:MAG: ABC transporter ATP-binding protein, partial [Anaerolineae bacterium]|nr:ABC transporter ATP-binding protein [Anaerolineae bacterium]